MNLGLNFRERLETFVQEELDQLVASISATWDIEHAVNGSHKAIHGESLTLASNTETGATGDITGDGDINMTGTGASSVGGDFSAQTGTSKTTIGLVGSITANDGALGPGVNMGSKMVSGESEDGSGNRRWSLIDLVAGMTPFIVRRFSGDYFAQPGPVSRAAGMLASLGNPNDSFRSGYWDGVYALKYYRNSATVAEGDWQDVTFAAGNFTASAGTWTLTSGDQTVFRYTLIGKTMIINYVFDTASVSGGQAQLRFAIPGGFVAAKDTYATCFYNDNAAGWVSNGNAFVLAAGTVVGLQPGALGVGTWTAAANTTYVRGTITFEVQ